MARLNTPVAPTHVTHEGAPARRISAEQELRRSVLACLLWEDSFYEQGHKIAHRIAGIARELSSEKVAQIAIEAREQMYLRHAPLWLVNAIAPRGGRIVGDTLARVIQRADEMPEFLAMYWKNGRTPLSAQVKRGLAEAFTQFDDYQLAKYDRAGQVRLRDVMFLTHPKPKGEEQADWWRRLAEDKLTPPDTWEVALSGGHDKHETWVRLLSENKIGGLALLRNLRNMLEVGVDPELIRAAIISHPFPRVLPFRFLAAARYAPELEDALETAMLRSTAALPKLTGRTTLLVDHSGSMAGRLSDRGTMIRFDAAAGLAVLLREVCEHVEVVAFSAPIDQGSYWYREDRLVDIGGRMLPLGVGRPPVAVVPPRRGFALRDALENATPWWGTNTEDGKRFCEERGYDRLILISDEESHQAVSNPRNGQGYLVNVAPEQRGVGYGPWVHIDGWSENVVRYITEFEALER